MNKTKLIARQLEIDIFFNKNVLVYFKYNCSTARVFVQKLLCGKRFVLLLGRKRIYICAPSRRRQS